MRAFDGLEVIDFHGALAIAIHREHMAFGIQPFDAVRAALEHAFAQLGESRYVQIEVIQG